MPRSHLELSQNNEDNLDMMLLIKEIDLFLFNVLRSHLSKIVIVKKYKPHQNRTKLLRMTNEIC